MSQQQDISDFQRATQSTLPGVTVFSTPIVLDQRDRNYFQHVSQVCYQITRELVKLGSIAVTNYSRELDSKWIYEIFRADIIYNPSTKQGKVIELNFGDPSGAGVMEAVYEGFFAFKKHERFRTMQRDFVAATLAESLSKFAKEKISAHSVNGKSLPLHLFLGMPKGVSVYYDFEILKKHWEPPFRTTLGDPKDIRWSSEHRRLLINGDPIDLIYRDLYYDWCIDGTEQLLESIATNIDETGFFPGISPFESRFLDSKGHLPLYEHAALEYGENFFASTVPLDQISLSPKKLRLVLTNREDWVLKFNFGYGGKDIFIGRFMTQEGWSKIIHERIVTDPHRYVLQEFHDLPKVDLEIVGEDGFQKQSYSMLMSLWVIGGSYSGCIVRASRSPVINVHQNCGFAPVFYEQ